MPKNNEIKSTLVQTYADDMAKVLETEKSGAIKQIIHSEEAYEEEKKELSPQSKKNELFMLIGAGLILVALAIFFFFFSQGEAPSVEVQKQFVPLIFTDKSSFIEVVGLKKDEIAKKILKVVVGTEVKVGGIEGMYLTLNKNVLGLRDFIDIISGNFVVGGDNFVEDGFLMGVVNNKTLDYFSSPEPASYSGRGFFILFKMRSLADVFASMHAWEAKMFADLHGFFGVDLSPETKYLLTKNFEDGIIQNKNARILYSEDNKIILAYVFADDHSVVITDSENAVAEIIRRLAASEVKK